MNEVSDEENVTKYHKGKVNRWMVNKLFQVLEFV